MSVHTAGHGNHSEIRPLAGHFQSPELRGRVLSQAWRTSRPTTPKASTTIQGRAKSRLVLVGDDWPSVVSPCPTGASPGPGAGAASPATVWLTPGEFKAMGAGSTRGWHKVWTTPEKPRAGLA